MSLQQDFANMIVLSRLGLEDPARISEQADRLIADTEQPDHWLLDISLSGTSVEIDHLVNSPCEQVLKEAVARGYTSWQNGEISEQKFAELCQKIWTADSGQEWYSRLAPIEDDLCQIRDGLQGKEKLAPRIQDRVEKLIQR